MAKKLAPVSIKTGAEVYDDRINLLEFLGYQFEVFYNGQVLGTDAFALAAFDAVAGFAEGMGQAFVVFALRCPGFGGQFLFFRII